MEQVSESRFEMYIALCKSVILYLLVATRPKMNPRHKRQLLWVLVVMPLPALEFFLFFFYFCFSGSKNNPKNTFFFFFFKYDSFCRNMLGKYFDLSSKIFRFWSKNG